MLLFWMILAALAGVFLLLAYRKNGKRGLCRGGLLLALSAVFVGLDQAVKLWARTVLEPVGTMPFIPHLLQLRFVLNTGAAFSMLEGRQLLLTLITSVVLACVGGYLILDPPQKKLEYSAWVLILAGGVGNLIDRVARGAVVDLFDTLFIKFAVFNVADICITVGFGLLLLFYLLQELSVRKMRKKGAERAGDTAAALPPEQQAAAGGGSNALSGEKPPAPVNDRKNAGREAGPKAEA